MCVCVCGVCVCVYGGVYGGGVYVHVCAVTSSYASAQVRGHNP